nr:hypothetical protein MACL_00002399 [Theileria orientalis]
MCDVSVMSVSYHGVLYPVDMISEGYGCCRHDIQPLHMVTGKLDGRAPTTRDRGRMALSGKVGYHQGTDYYGYVMAVVNVSVMDNVLSRVNVVAVAIVLPRVDLRQAGSRGQRISKDEYA